MSCDSNLFLKYGINRLGLVDYLETKYTDVYYKEVMDLDYFNIFFKDGADSRRLFVYIHNIDNAERPVSIIPNVSCTLILGLWGNGVQILQDIAKHFGGGYVRDNDCGEDESSKWYYVNGDSNSKSIATDREDKIYQFVQNALSKTEADLNAIELTRFLISHIEEIKHL